MRVAAIGPATRAALQQHGIHVHVTPKEYVAESVVRALKNRVRGRRMLLVRAAVARRVLPKELRRAGARVTVATAYETRAPRAAAGQLRKLFSDPRKKPAMVTCTSSSAVNNYLELTRRIPAARRVAFASIGPITSATLRQNGIEPAVEARSYTAKGLAQAIVRWARTHGRADL
jgi:uroporphyrinogen-III synthase